jgi:hypothetical protein
MARFVWLAVVCAFTLVGGCAAPAKYIERKSDSGVVAVPDNTDTWPNYNRRAAMELIQKHVGPEYEIVEEKLVVTGHTVQNNRNVNTEPIVNPRNPALVGQRQTVSDNTTQQEITQWQISYRKKPFPMPRELLSQEQPGVVPASGTGVAVPTQPLPATPTPRPALPSVFNRGSTSAPATGGADCNH